MSIPLHIQMQLVFKMPQESAAEYVEANADVRAALTARYAELQAMEAAGRLGACIASRELYQKLGPILRAAGVI